jgi:hypothetical protein
MEVRVGPEKVSLVGELWAQGEGEEAPDPGSEAVSWGEKKRRGDRLPGVRRQGGWRVEGEVAWSAYPPGWPSHLIYPLGNTVKGPRKSDCRIVAETSSLTTRAPAASAIATGVGEVDRSKFPLLWVECGDQASRLVPAGDRISFSPQSASHELQLK